jgi:superfamily I DNA/RNA helicase
MEHEFKKALYKYYADYETLKEQSNTLDFDDLLFKAYQLLNARPELIDVSGILLTLNLIN